MVPLPRHFLRDHGHPFLGQNLRPARSFVGPSGNRIPRDRRHDACALRGPMMIRVPTRMQFPLGLLGAHENPRDSRFRVTRSYAAQLANLSVIPARRRVRRHALGSRSSCCTAEMGLHNPKVGGSNRPRHFLKARSRRRESDDGSVRTKSAERRY